MPERPELDYVQRVLQPQLVGRVIESLTVLEPVVLSVTVAGDPRESLPGRRISEVTRRGQWEVWG